MVEVLGPPTELVNQGAEGERRVDDPPGDHDVSSGVESGGDGERSEIHARRKGTIRTESGLREIVPINHGYSAIRIPRGDDLGRGPGVDSTCVGDPP